MPQFRIVTDGSCDLPAEWCKAHQIAVIPLYYSIASAVPEKFPGDRALSGTEFCEILRQGTSVRTSAPSIEDCKELLRPLLIGGNDILYTGLSAKLSGMFNVMRLAAMELGEEYPDRHIITVDSRAGSLGVGMIVRQLAALREQGEGFDETCAACEELRDRTSCRFTVSDLMYLKRGGRISGGAAVVGTVLRIMPLLHTNAEGAIEPYAKVRGRKIALRTLADELGEEAAPDTTVYIGHCDAPEDAAFVREILKRKYAVRDVQIGEIGPVLSAHAGPDAIAGFCLRKPE